MKLPSDGSRIGYQEIAVSANTSFTLDFFYFLDDPDLGTLTVDVLAGGGYDANQSLATGTVLGTFTDKSATAYTYESIAFNSGSNTIESLYIHNEGVEAQVDDISINCNSSNG